MKKFRRQSSQLNRMSWATILLLNAGSCGFSPESDVVLATDCGGNTASNEIGAPQLLAFDFVQTHPADSWLLVNSFNFSDADGDLGLGYVEIYINDFRSPNLTTELQDNFIAYFGDLGKTEGTLPLLLRLGAEPEANGGTVRLSVQLVDGANKRSNCRAFSMKLLITPTGTSGGGGQGCDPTVSTCLKNEGESCNTNEECSATCRQNTCGPIGSTGEGCDPLDDNDCSIAHTCDPGSRTCLLKNGESCDTNEECSATCRQNTCGPIGGTGERCDPLDDNDCSMTHSCAPGSQTCLLKNGQSCTTNGDCLNTCVGNECVVLGGNNAACDPSDNSDCIAGRICEAGSNICLCDGNDCPKEDGQQCTINAECANVCIQSVCSPQAPTGELCETDTDCITGHRCENSLCLRDDGQSCTRNKECVNVCINQQCAMASGTGGDCESSDLNEDCAANHICSDVTEICLLENGQSCRNNTNCHETCLGNTCAPKATTLETCDADDNEDCAPNHVCQTTSNQCVLVNGQPCTTDDQCKNACKSGVCANRSAAGEAGDAGGPVGPP